MTLDQCVEALSLTTSFCKCSIVQYSMVTTPSKGVHSQAILVVCQKKAKPPKTVKNQCKMGLLQVLDKRVSALESKWEVNHCVF